MDEKDIWMRHIDCEASRMHWRIPEELKMYFCNLMIFSVRNRDWVTPYALCEFWKLQRLESQCAHSWQFLGESCLLTAGFFCEMLESNPQSLNVYRKIGRASYREATALNVQSNRLLNQVIDAYDDLTVLTRGMRQPYWQRGN